MKFIIPLLLTTVYILLIPSPIQAATYHEQNGLVAVEAEDFTTQTKDSTRKWYITSPTTNPGITPDPDPNHSSGASGNAYLEILPDTRVTHNDPLVSGVSFSNTPGQMTILSYQINFITTGKYYVWARAYSTGTEDNGVHVGLNGTWPQSGAKMQWCSGKNTWTWENRQRDSGGSSCGQLHTISLNIDSPGVHTISFSMREDGFEMDKFLLTTDVNYTPSGTGPTSNTDNQPSASPLPTPSPTPTPPTGGCPTDINSDRITDLRDYSILVNQFFQTGNLSADINDDQIVDLSDYSSLVANFLKPC